MAEGTPDGDAQAEIGGAVDDALADEVKRQRARFVQAYIGVDRAEGVGRGEEHWNESLHRDLYRDLYRDLGVDPPAGPDDD
ncbi:hypothetical protein [Actinomycetospora cinnamomea]|uniref:Uncharacterized protein n=1 Tax=Actinomycetospora cinnamomea TaxID=663609 RepID=A0A2U1EU68_9PSEU|nr:hypothetical protein [Actinomycetospora cinnamomea]PVZ03478.1 hypothetical protein C8D89_12179 [Actinomycetospora cinnamomea]